MPKNNVLYNSIAEQNVLGAMIENINCRSEALSALTSEDFYEGNPGHRIIFNAIARLVNNAKTIDITTLTDELITMKELEAVGGVDYLSSLQDTYISERHSIFHINIVKDLSLVRNLLKTFKQIDKDYNTTDIKSIPDFVAESEKRILEITKARRVGAFKSSKEVVDLITTKLKMNENKRSNSYITGIDTGFNQLNRFTQGFQPGSLIILAARPSVGKTALAINLAYNAASLNNKTVAFFSLEMSAEDIIRRLLASTSLINSSNINTGNLTEEDWLALSESVNAIKKTNLLIDDTSGIKIADIRTKLQKLKAQDDNLGLVVIDYLGLIRTNNTKLDNHQLEIGEISRTLKEIAREISVPILCLCQLSRASEKRTDRTPVLSDLRDSGSIEQDADQVLFIHRPNYQKADEMRKEAQTNVDDNDPYGKIEETQIVIQKNRNGRTGIVYMNFLMNVGKFIEADAPKKEQE